MIRITLITTAGEVYEASACGPAAAAEAVQVFRARHPRYKRITVVYP